MPVTVRHVNQRTGAAYFYQTNQAGPRSAAHGQVAYQPYCVGHPAPAALRATSCRTCGGANWRPGYATCTACNRG